LLRYFVGNVTVLFGGANTAINKKIDDTHDEAIQELIKYTTAKYPSATAIAGISISLTELREFIICVACGTALAPKTSSSSMEPRPRPEPLPVVKQTGGNYSKIKSTRTRTRTRKNTKRRR
jgi:uncharacterized protein YbjQ (UPF0145 family)